MRRSCHDKLPKRCCPRLLHTASHPLSHLCCLQVGNYTTDQDYWGRPEDYTLDRPYYIAGADTGATNLAATMASALAATATVWKSSDTAYYTTLMTAAVELYTYATKILNPYGAIVSHLAFHQYLSVGTTFSMYIKLPVGASAPQCGPWQPEDW